MFAVFIAEFGKWYRDVEKHDMKLSKGTLSSSSLPTYKHNHLSKNVTRL